MAVAVANPRSRNATVVAPTYAGVRSGHNYSLGQQIGAGGNGIVYTVSQPPYVSINELLIRPTRQTR